MLAKTGFIRTSPMPPAAKTIVASAGGVALATGVRLKSAVTAGLEHKLHLGPQVPLVIVVVIGQAHQRVARNDARRGGIEKPLEINRELRGVAFGNEVVVDTDGDGREIVIGAEHIPVTVGEDHVVAGKEFGLGRDKDAALKEEAEIHGRSQRLAHAHSGAP